MKTATSIWIIGPFVALLVVGCDDKQKSAEPSAGAVPRVGVFDSRAVAIAFTGTQLFADQQQQLMDRYEKAKRTGDAQLIAALEAEGQARQDQLHRQGFSTAPIDNILAHLAEQLPQIMSQANVEAICCKWDQALLAQYGEIVQVDITMQLVDAFAPSDQQRQHAVDIQQQPPIPLEELEQLMAAGGIE